MPALNRLFDLLSFMGGTPPQLSQQLQTPSTHTEDDAKETALAHPKHMLCPLSCGLFQDPVVAMDGVTYEHRDIRHYFENKPDSGPFMGPVGREMPSKYLVPNLNLRSEVIEYRIANQLPQLWCVPWQPRKAPARQQPLYLQVLRNGVENLQTGKDAKAKKVHDAIDELHTQMLSPADAAEFHHLKRLWADLRKAPLS